jgi:hypothetical protein
LPEHSKEGRRISEDAFEKDSDLPSPETAEDVDDCSMEPDGSAQWRTWRERFMARTNATRPWFSVFELWPLDEQLYFALVMLHLEILQHHGDRDPLLALCREASLATAQVSHQCTPVQDGHRLNVNVT